MRKKLLSILLVLSLMFALVPAAFAADIIQSGNCGTEGDGSNVTWTLDSDRTLVVSGRGAICDNAFIGLFYVGDVIIEPGVTEIGHGAFGPLGFTSISIPATVHTIGSSAFADCRFQSFTVPGTVKTVGYAAFQHCYSLKTMVLGDGVETLEDSVFYYCESLETVRIPASVKHLGSGLFDNCSGVTVDYCGTPEQWDAIEKDCADDASFAEVNVRFFADQHTYGPWVVTREPTCTEPGEKVSTCTDDGCTQTATAAVPALGHDLGAESGRIDPDGVLCGLSERTCRRCGGKSYTVLDPEIWAYEQYGDLDPYDWSYEGIQFCVMMGYMTGPSATVFAPRAVTTRAQLVQILYNFVGEPAVTGETPVTDLTQNWYKDAVLWAHQSGVVAGTSDTTFSPNAPVTREQIAVLLAEFADKVLDIGGAETPADLSVYPDGAQVSSWARDAMADAVALGILNGAKDSDGRIWLRPQGQATRAEVATLLEGFCLSLG